MDISCRGRFRNQAMVELHTCFFIDRTHRTAFHCPVKRGAFFIAEVICRKMRNIQSESLFQISLPCLKAMSVEDAFLVLEAASSVVFIPGYGMAVAQAQHSVKELANKLEQNGAEVNFAIHPVAGRMPGHMNVLLAEADVPYEQLKTSDEMNPTMSMQDVAIIIGANDVVNPAALNDESSPIYGMPIINAFEARTVFVLKRGKGAGFSGIENPLFTNDNTVMIYGDAKQTVSALVSEFDE